MNDLLGYANTSGDLPVVLAAVIHAQFETIHPFEDGNGRVGRALVHAVFQRAGIIDGGAVPLSTALRNDETGYVAALTTYRYDGDERAPALNAYVSRFLSYLETATATAGRFADAAGQLHGRWRAAVSGVRADAALHRAIDVVVENPVISTAFLAEGLGVSLRLAQNVVHQLVDARILTPSTGKYRRLPLYQANDILDLLAFGTEAGPHTRTPTALDDDRGGHPELVRRCGQPTSKGPCRNRVPDLGQTCWRHRP